MTVQTTTHLNFHGEARAALGFYCEAFGGTQTVVTYRELGGAADPAQAEQVVWGQVVSEQGFRIMAFDVQSEKSWHPGENAFYVSVRSDSSDEITGYWNKLADGATILHPLGPAPWSPRYGMLKDRFGITWILDVATERPAA